MAAAGATADRPRTDLSDATSATPDPPTSTAPVAAQGDSAFVLSPRWLSLLSRQQLEELTSDLAFLRTKFDLDVAELLCDDSSRLQIRLAAEDPDKLGRARAELTRSEGLLEFYMAGASSSEPANSSKDAAEQRMDPYDGQVWLWDAFRLHYKDRYSLDELVEYWQGMALATASHSKSVDSKQVWHE